MNVWWCLFRKEFRLMRSFWMIAGLVLIIAGMAGAYLASRFHSGIPSIGLFVVMFWHSFYLLLYLLVSLRAEKNNTPIWMKSPQPAWLLLSAKFAAGLVLLYASLAVNLLLWLWVLHLDFQTGVYQGLLPFRKLLSVADLMQQHWALSILAITERALCLAVLGALIYFFVDTLKYYLKGWRWIVGLVLFFAVMFVSSCFEHTSIFAVLFHWGRLDLSGFPALDIHERVPGPPVMHIFQWFFPIYWGVVLYKFLLFVIGFYIAAWLLDRKVEV